MMLIWGMQDRAAVICKAKKAVRLRRYTRLRCDAAYRRPLLLERRFPRISHRIHYNAFWLRRGTNSAATRKLRNP